jgi:Raf kinase inhibitor-like YbhB/YbcL family protein
VHDIRRPFAEGVRRGILSRLAAMLVRRQASLLALVTTVAIAASLTACSDDGRDMRDPVLPLPATTTTVAPTLPAGESAFVTLATTTLPATLQLVASWPNGGDIPVRYTCDDLDVAPALSWTDVPAGTVELAVTMTDLTAGPAHWIMFGLDPTRTGLAENEVPTGAVQWPNDFGNAGWDGPCPPAADEAHTYMFTLHALNQQVEVADDAPSTELISILNQTAIAQSSVSGLYARAE